MRTLPFVLAAAVAFVAAPVAAQAQTVVRGVVSAVTATQLTVKPAAGKPVVVALTPDWAVQVTKPINVSAIVPGSFVGTAEIPGKDGVGRSLEVHVFPPGVKIGEGHYRWDLKKGSMMTNGTVGKVTAGAKGRELEISYPTGKRKVVVPPNVPVVQIVNGEKSMIKPGAKVFLVAFPNPAGGGLVTGAVAVGVNGAAPPM
jgi:hypothetical protein